MTNDVKSVFEIAEMLPSELLANLLENAELSIEISIFTKQLSKSLSNYDRAVRSSQDPKEDPQKKHFQNLETTTARLLKILDGLSKENTSLVDYKIMSRPPYDAHSFFPEQIDYWDENKDSVELATKKLRQILTATKDINVQFKDGPHDFHYTHNLALDHLIQDLAWGFEQGTDVKPASQCYYNDQISSYKGQFFDFVVTILDFYAPKSYHSKGALGKRISRVLALLEPKDS